MQAEADKEPAAAPAAAGKPPSICDRLQRAFHARPAFGPLRRLTVRHHHQDGGAAKPAGDRASAAAPGAAPEHTGPPVPVPAAPRTLTPRPATAPQSEQPVPVRLPAVASKVAAGGAPTGPPVPVRPPDVMAGMATAADAKAGAGERKTRAGFRVRKALSSE